MLSMTVLSYVNNFRFNLVSKTFGFVIIENNYEIQKNLITLMRESFFHLQAYGSTCFGFYFYFTSFYKWMINEW